MSEAGSVGTAAAGGAVVQAIKASGPCVRVDADTFLLLVRKQDESLVVHALAGMFTRTHQYLCSYKGLVFYAMSPAPLPLPETAGVIEARSISIPD